MSLIRPDERRLVGALMVLSFLQGVSNTLGAAVGKSLFLSRIGAEALPFAYGAVSIALPLLGVLFIAASRRVSPRVLLAGTALLSAAIHGAIWFGLHRGLDQPAAALAMVWVDVDWSLVLLVFLGLAAHRLDVRQQRRLLGVAAAGDVLAGIGGGYVLPLVLPVLGLENVPLLAAGAQLLAAGLVAALLADSGGRPKEATPIRSLLGDRFLRSAWTMLALGWVAFYLIDALFLSVASQRYPSDAEMASFMGVFLGTAAVADAVATLGLYGFLLSRFGVLGGLLGGPVATAALAACVLFALGLPGLVLLGAASALKLADITARENITEPAVSTLYGALPPGDRSAAQAIGGAVVGPLAGLLAAPAMWVVLGPLDLGLSGLTVLTLGLLMGICLLAVAIGRAWPQALRKALVRGGHAEADVTLGTGNQDDTLIDGLMAAEPEMVLASARLLRTLDADTLIEHLPGLLAHRSSEVRLGVARLLEEAPHRAAFGKLAARMVEEPDVNVRARIYRALMATDPKLGLELLDARVRTAQLADRGAALDALLRHGDDRAEPLIEAGLGRLEAGDDVERSVAERLRAQTRPWDEEELVQRMTQFDPWTLSPMLRRRRIAPEQVVRAVANAWSRLDPFRRRRGTITLGVLAPQLGRPVLLRALDEPAAADEALQALAADGLDDEESSAILLRIDDDVWAIPALRAAAAEAPPLLARAYLDDADAAVRRLLLAFALLHPEAPDLGTLWGPLHDPEGRAIALEILENTLSRADWRRLEPLLPGEAPAVRHETVDEAALSPWTLLCRDDPAEAARRAAAFAPLRQVRFLAGLSDGELAGLAERVPALLAWKESSGAIDDLPDAVIESLLIDLPDARRPVLEALVGLGRPTRPALGGLRTSLAPSEILLAVRACAELEHAPPRVHRMLVGAAEVRTLEAADPLMQRGQPGGAAVLVVSGTLDAAGAGVLVGVRSALAGGAWSRDATALQRTTVLVFPGSALMQAAASSSSVALALWRRLGR